jgi:rubrerythrin
MERKFYKELWDIRFNKMLVLERQGIVAYQGLLQECKTKHKGHSVEAHLERLIADEKRHAILVEELLQILDAQPD